MPNVVQLLKCSLEVDVVDLQVATSPLQTAGSPLEVVVVVGLQVATFPLQTASFPLEVVVARSPSVDSASWRQGFCSRN